MEWIGSGTRTYLTTVDSVLKLHLYISTTKYDDLLTEYIQAASELIEKYVGFPLTYAEITVFAECLKRGELLLPANIDEITEISFMDSYTWEPQCISCGELINKKRNTVYLNEDLSIGDYKLTATTSISVNPNIVQCCRMLVAEMFENRENKAYNGGWDLVSRKLHFEESFI